MPLSPTYSPSGPHSAPAARHHNPLARLGEALLEMVVRPLRLRHARAKLRQELAGLDHRERKDIGISDLETFVAGWRPGQRD